MGTTALSVIRQEVSEEIGDWLSGTSTATGSSTTLVDSGLKYRPDDYFNGFWLLITSGTYAGSERFISVFTSSSGTITWLAALAGNSGSGVTYEIHRFRPLDITGAINDARIEAYPYLHRRVIDESLVTGSHLLDGGFEDWSSTTVLNNWTNTGTGTFAQRTTPVNGRLWDKYAVTVTPGGANGGIRQGQAQNVGLSDLCGHTVYFKAWVNGTAADAIIRITDDDGNTDSDAVAASATWELLECQRTIKSDSVTVQFDILSPGNNAFYVDNARVTGPANYRYRMFTHLEDILEVGYQSASGGLNNYPCDDLVAKLPYVRLKNSRYIYDGTKREIFLMDSPLDNRKLRIIGKGPLSSVSADADTMELDGNHIRVIVALAASKLYKRYANVVSGEDRNNYLQIAEDHQREYIVRRNRFCHAEPVVLSSGI